MFTHMTIAACSVCVLTNYTLYPSRTAALILPLWHHHKGRIHFAALSIHLLVHWPWLIALFSTPLHFTHCHWLWCLTDRLLAFEACTHRGKQTGACVYDGTHDRCNTSHNSYTHRNHRLLCHPSRVNSFRYSYFVNAPFLWNDLPTDITSTVSVTTFKHALYTHLSTNQSS